MDTITCTVADHASGQPKRVVLRDAERYHVLKAHLTAVWPLILAGQNNPRTGLPFTATDAAEGLVFSVGQLAYTESVLRERYFKKMQYQDLMKGCISFEAGEWATTVDYEIYEAKGNARFISGGADDIPYTDVSYARKSIPIHHGAVGYQFTQQELRATAFLKRPLPERRLANAIASYERFANVVALKGDTSKNITGLLNNANVTHATRPSGKAWTGAAAGTDVVSDIAYGLYQTWINSGFNEIADVVGIPPNAWQWITSNPMSATYPLMTVMKFLRDNNLGDSLPQKKVIDFVPIYDADTIGAGSTGRAVFWVRDRDTLEFNIPMPLRFLAPQLDGLVVRIPGEFRMSGVEVARPTNVYYMDGVQ